jgi:imidazolonepropionase-like amidohydrolase
MTPMQAIVAATKNTAEAMDMADDIGSIDAEKKADIIAVDNDPTANISALEKVSFVMKGGKVMKQVSSI